MAFSSVTFLFLYLPIVLVGYCALWLPVALGWPRVIWQRLGNAYLLAASLFFYGWGEQNRVFVLLAIAAVDFWAAWLIGGGDAGRSRRPFERAVLAAAIATNLIALCYFKYLGFLLHAGRELLEAAHLPSFDDSGIRKVALPLGISFFTFHSMSYVIDVYRRQVKPTRSFIDYATYVFMFPQLVAGPIVRFSQVAKALTHRNLTLESWSSGVTRFTLGLSKKCLIADTVAVAADAIFALPTAQLTAGSAWMGTLAYSVQIYFDFSGYSDMAIGLGRMLGFELPINFNYPYAARSVADFWRRWHISLSTWFRDYVWFSLGGNKGSRLGVVLKVALVFFLCGLWHGASWTFVVWGLFHGACLVLERLPVLARALARSQVLGRVYTLGAVGAGWILFRSASFAQTRVFVARMLGVSSPTLPAIPLRWFATNDVCIALGLGLLLSVPLVQPLLSRLVQSTADEGVPRLPRLLLASSGVGAVALALVACAASVATTTHSPFIYFRF